MKKAILSTSLKVIPFMEIWLFKLRKECNPRILELSTEIEYNKHSTFMYSINQGLNSRYFPYEDYEPELKNLGGFQLFI